jgi:Flp pilus assembly protein TadD
MAGTTLAAGLTFTAMAPITSGIFTVSAQTQETQYNPQADPLEANPRISDMATYAMGSATNMRERVQALFDMIKTTSPTGLKAGLNTGRTPRSAAQTLQKKGDCSELAGVVLSLIDAMNAQGAAIETDALVVHFRNKPADDFHMIARARIGDMQVIIDPQAATLGATKDGSYEVLFRLAPQEVAEMYHTKYGDYFKDHGDEARAMVAYKRAIEIFNGDAYAHYKLGILYGAAGEMDAAKRQFDVADSLAPGKYARYKARGTYNQELQQGDAAYKGENWGEADKHFRNALEVGRRLRHDDSATINEYIVDCAKRQIKLGIGSHDDSATVAGQQ